MAIKAVNQIDVIDLTDGYSVILTNDNYTFLGTTNSVQGTQTTTTKVMALCGSDQVPCTVGTITCPTGISAVSDGKSPEPTITITATSALTKSGTITIPIIVNGEITIEKTFSFSIAFKGNTGQNGTSVTVKSTSITYQVGTSGTAKPTGEWKTEIPNVPNGQYLWTKTVVTYSNGQKTESYSVSYKGTNGTNGKDGLDAITMAITSSAGTIFKNTAIATTLTAHVYKGGVEVTGANLAALGTIKWYKDGGTTAVATGATYTIGAGDVNNKATFSAQLEG